MSTEKEIVRCVTSCEPDVIMHTNSSYPSKINELNLNYISHLKQKYAEKEIGYRMRKLKDENIVVKLHPSFKPRGKTKDVVDTWIQNDIDVRTGYNYIHDFLPHARVAILDNSTSGIECLMHEVPIISYGWPEYHWVTKKLQSLTQLSTLCTDVDNWSTPHFKEDARNFVYWYINDYLCHDTHSTVKRLEECLDVFKSKQS